MRKRILALVLAIVMCISLLPAGALADELDGIFDGSGIFADGQCGDNAYWSLSSDGVLTISGRGEMWDYSDWDNPPWAEYNGNTSGNASGDAPHDDSEVKVTSVVIEDGITTIGNYAFYNCKFLTSVTIPDSVTSIGGSAFSDCSNLTSVSIPDSVRSIGGGAFAYCSSLTSVTIPDSVTSIGEWAFAYCSSLTSVTIPDGVTSIGGCVFYNCESLESVTIPDSVTSIGSSAFSDCSNLTSVVIPDSVTSIGEWAFSSCSNLTSVVIPDSVTSIGDYTFYYCHALTSVTIPDSVESIGDYAFYATPWLESLGDFAIIKGTLHKYNGSDRNVVIPDGVTRIGCQAFAWCGLESVTIPKSVTSIGDEAFAGCYDLESVTIPDSVTSIGDNVFYDTAYYNNSNNWDNGLLYIGNYLIDAKEDITSADIKYGTKLIADNTFAWCYNLTSVTIPDSVTSIGKYAFYECYDLKSVTIGSSVTSIGEWAFAWCGLESVTIPESVTSIGDHAFRNCSSLTSVVIPDSVTSIGEFAFYYCESLKSVTIPDSVTSIGSSAFSDCSSLKSVTIPESVTSIGEWAFSWCGLEYILFKGDAPDGNWWESVWCTLWIPADNDTWKKDIEEDYGEYYWHGIPVKYGEPHIHSYTKTVVPATEDTLGYTEYTCNDCGYSYRDNYTSINGYPCGACGDTVYWELSDGVLTVFGEGVMDDYGYDARGEYWYSDTPSWNEYRENVTEIIVKDGVTSIGIGAFAQLSRAKSVTIPDSVKGIGGSAFSGCSSLESVTIPDGVMSIDSQMFYGCSNLKSVMIPDSVESIGWQAFADCSGLESIMIPDSVMSIDSGVFRNCSALKYAAFMGDEPLQSYYDIFEDCAKDFTVYAPAGNSTWTSSEVYNSAKQTWCGLPIMFCEPHIHSFAESVVEPTENSLGYTEHKCSVCDYGYKENYTSINACPCGVCGYSVYWELCDGVLTVFGEGAMDDYEYSGFGYWYGSTPTWNEYIESITEIIVKDGVTSIGSSAFAQCTGAKSVTIPGSVTSIGSSAFSGCSNLTSVVIPNGVTSISDNVFRDCSSLKSVTIPDSVTSIGWQAFFECSSLESITIPASVTDIASDAFYGTPWFEAQGDFVIVNGILLEYRGKDTNIKIPDGVREIKKISSDYEFKSNIESVTMPDSVTSIEGYAFNDFEKLESVTLSKNITSIQYATFCGCSSLAELEIPSGVTSIDHHAFRDCSSLKSIAIPDGVQSIGEYAFSYCESLESITMPDGLTNFGQYAFSHTPWLASLGDFAAVNGLLITYQGEAADVTIPNGITTIGARAFSGDRDLMSVTIPEGVTEIGEMAFFDCGSLTSITMPESLKSIGDDAFLFCESLTNVTIPANVTDIGAAAFSWCFNITDITIPGAMKTVPVSMFYNCGGLENVTISEGVTEIGESAFYGCTKLKSAAIPQSVISINKNAFMYCEQLSDIYYGGTEEQWNQIIIYKHTLPDGVNVHFAQHTHSYTPVVTAPTCTNKGYTTYTCSCGARYVSDYVDALSHKTETKNTKEATCTAEGYTGDKVCTVCGDTVEKGKTIAKLDHNYTRVVTKPTCTEKGYTTYTCSECGYNYKDNYVNALGHDTELVNAKAATCTNAGYTGDKVCTVCGETVEKGKTIAKLGHSYTDKVVKPTASKQGYTQHTCSVCGDSYKDNYTVAAPTITLSNVASSGKIKLSWSKITGAEKYYVYRAASRTGTYSRIATVTDLSYTDSKATAAKTYYYKVKAVKSNGTTSAYSSVKYLTCDLARPTVTLSNVASSGKIKLSWSKITGAEKYYIYRSTDGETYSYVTSTTSTSYTDSKATAKKKYYYRVKAVCSVSAATSAQSTAKSLTCDLARPTVKITTSKGDPKLSWAKVTGATKYEVYRATSKSGTYSKMITTSKTSYTNTSAKAGKTYYYKVKAVCGTSAAASAYSTVVSIKAK